jgi:hypothetical protein
LYYVLLAVNPFGGIAIAIPFAMIKLHYPAWLVIATGVPLSYLQVLAVDLGWSLLERRTWWRALLERWRSERLERLAASRGAFIPTAILTPIIGPWLVMAVMRCANVPHRRVLAPILTGITAVAVAITLLSAYAPSLLGG